MLELLTVWLPSNSLVNGPMVSHRHLVFGIFTIFDTKSREYKLVLPFSQFFWARSWSTFLFQRIMSCVSSVTYKYIMEIELERSVSMRICKHNELAD
ncbi:hypothetical protein Y032_0227g2810 [Ancylostoma ceylanicum]|uniref:Uncharacterized protein n=1 Tax=Ancylostoma ceylanicum TaxID=53326 RepID=A0A016SGI3_9BILA|nr:hypothetical protein Y032_0227g2810 [Ancylostoma ceylanicum]